MHCIFGLLIFLLSLVVNESYSNPRSNKLRAISNSISVVNQNRNNILRSQTTLNVAVGQHNNLNDKKQSDLVSTVTYRNNLPVELPILSQKELVQLARGERIQKQSRTGRAGYGVVVVDVPAEVDTVFHTLTQFAKYCEMIPTIRNAKVNKVGDSLYKAQYALSKFRLKVNIEHKIDAEERIISFALDRSKTNVVLNTADGFWYVESVPNQPLKTRVWLSANILASPLVPSMIVDYAAYKALPRATSWLQPFFAGQRVPTEEGFC